MTRGLCGHRCRPGPMPAVDPRQRDAIQCGLRYAPATSRRRQVRRPDRWATGAPDFPAGRKGPAPGTLDLLGFGPSPSQPAGLFYLRLGGKSRPDTLSCRSADGWTGGAPGDATPEVPAGRLMAAPTGGRTWRSASGRERSGRLQDARSVGCRPPRLGFALSLMAPQPPPSPAPAPLPESLRVALATPR